MENQTEKQVERIGNEVAKAVEAMKEAGQQGKEQPTNEPKLRARTLKRMKRLSYRKKSTARQKS